MSLLEVKHVKKTYSVGTMMSKKYLIHAVRDISFSLEEGKCIGIVGESGCGKSTLGRMIAGIETMDSGEIWFLEEIIDSCHKQSAWRQKIQMVFQDSYDAGNPRMTAKEILEEPLNNFFNLSRNELNNRLEELMTIVGLPISELGKRPHQFSGGQLQRICIARALAANPSLIVLDEPLSSLDVSVQAQILNLLQDIKIRNGVSYILISHDIEAVYYMADSLAVIYGGEIVERLDDICNIKFLVHPYSKRLMKPLSERDTIEEATIMIPFKSKQKGCIYAARCEKAQDICFKQSCTLSKISTGHYCACHFVNQ